MINIVKCSNCGASVHATEATEVREAPTGELVKLCNGCTWSCEEPTLVDMAVILGQLVEEVESEDHGLKSVAV